MLLAVASSTLPAAEKTNEISGDLVVFHAGSLAIPFKQIAEEFQQEFPRVRVLREAAGSRMCARKISELKKPCDVFASADYTVIDALLIPEYADWSIKFAVNEMAIACHRKSRRVNEISKENWYEILMKPDVAFGRSDPNSDPCGYRAVLTMKLAERFYKKKGLADAMRKKDAQHIRPKATDLLALLEVGEIDYIFLYRSVAEQHGLETVLLPDEVNLKNPELAHLYNTVSVEVTGRKPGATITKRGEPIIYGVTIPRDSPNRKAAAAFVTFLLDKNKGMTIMEKNGQSPVGEELECWNNGSMDELNVQHSNLSVFH